MSSEQEVQALFRAERAVQPAATSVEHGWQRLVVDLAANVAPAPVAGGAAKLGSGLISKWLLAGFTVGVVGVGAGAQLLSPASTPPHARALPAHVVPDAVRAAPRIPETNAATEVSAPVSVRTRPTSRELSVPAPQDRVPATTFDAELKLISFAKSELDAHRPRQASAWLAEHAERFPHGVFALEREALQILADCESGPKNDAPARAFATRHPGSPLVERLRRACGADVEFQKSSNAGTPLGERTAEPSKGEQR